MEWFAKRREGNDVEPVRRPLRACENYWRWRDSLVLVMRERRERFDVVEEV